MEIKINAKTDLALKGLKNHYSSTRTLKAKMGLGAWGVTHKLENKTLYINLAGLVKIILRKGGSVKQLKEQMKQDFVKEVAKAMEALNVKPNEYEVMFIGC